MHTICPACKSELNSIAAEYVTCPCGHRFHIDDVIETVTEENGIRFVSRQPVLVGYPIREVA